MLTLAEKQKIFDNEFSLWGWDISNGYKYLCLVGALYEAAKKGNPKVTVYQILNKIDSDWKPYGKLFENTHIHIMSHVGSEHSVVYPTFGLTSPKEIVAEIKRLLETWLPF